MQPDSTPCGQGTWAISNLKIEENSVRRTIFNLASVAGLALVAGSVANGASFNLHVNPGLWEVTSTAKMSGIPTVSQDMLAQLPPAQRAKIQAQIQAAMANSQKPRTVKSCVTQKDLDRPFHGMEDRPGMSCQENVTSSSWTSQNMSISCTSKHGSTTTGTVHFEAPSPTAMKGIVAVNADDHGHPVTVKVEIAGHWLGANCGDTKPFRHS